MVGKLKGESRDDASDVASVSICTRPEEASAVGVQAFAEAVR